MSNRLLHLIVLLFALMGTAEAQVSTMYAMPVGASSGGGLYVVVGELFSGSASGGGYEASAGIAVSHLEREDYVETVAFGEGYEGHGFSYPATTPIGTYSGKIYTPYGGSYKYDLLKTLKLRVLGPFSCGDLVYDGDNNPYPTVDVASYCWTQTNLRAQHYGRARDGCRRLCAGNLPLGMAYSHCRGNECVGDSRRRGHPQHRTLDHPEQQH